MGSSLPSTSAGPDFRCEHCGPDGGEGKYQHVEYTRALGTHGARIAERAEGRWESYVRAQAAAAAQHVEAENAAAADQTKPYVAPAVDQGSAETPQGSTGGGWVAYGGIDSWETAQQGNGGHLCEPASDSGSPEERLHGCDHPSHLGGGQASAKSGQEPGPWLGPANLHQGEVPHPKAMGN